MSETSGTSTIKGLYISQARKIAKKFFGNHLDKVVHSQKCFDVHVYDSVDKKELDRFMDMWEEFNIILIATTQYKKSKSSSK